MNRHQRRASAAQAKTHAIQFLEGSGEHYSKKSANGLVQVHFLFGMVRPPKGEDEVRDAFRDLANELRKFADGIDRTNETAPSFTGDPGDA